MLRLSLGVLVFLLSACAPDGAFSGEDEVLRFRSDLHNTDHWRPGAQPLATGTSFELFVLGVQDAEISVDGAAAATWRGPDFVRVEALQAGEAWIDVEAWNEGGDELHDGVGFDVADVGGLSMIDEAARQFAWVQQLAVEHEVPVRVVGDPPAVDGRIRPLVRGSDVTMLPILLDDQGRSLRYDLADVTVDGARARDGRFWLDPSNGPTTVRHRGAVSGVILFEPAQVDDVAYVEVVAVDVGLAGPELCVNAVVWAAPYTADGRRILGAPMRIEASGDVTVSPLVEELPLDEIVRVYTVADTPSPELELFVTVGDTAQRVVLPIGLLPIKESCS